MERKITQELTQGSDGELEFVPTEETVTDREVLPNATIAIFLAKGIFPEKFADQSKVQHDVNVTDDSWFAKLPFESQLEIIRIRNAAAKQTESPASPAELED